MRPHLIEDICQPNRERLLITHQSTHTTTVWARSLPARSNCCASPNLASWSGQAGNAAGARDQYAILLPIVERILGAEHPETLTVRANLTGWSGEMGDAAGARDQYAALLPIRNRALEAKHPDTLTIRANLAAWTGETGDAAGARDQYAALLPIYERILGAGHPNILTIRGNLAYCTEQADIDGLRDGS
jgi:Tetratricopeptide repeat